MKDSYYQNLMYWQMCGLFIALILRYSIVYFKLNVLYLSIPIILMSLIPFLIKFIIYKCNIISILIELKLKNKLKDILVIF